MCRFNFTDDSIDISIRQRAFINSGGKVTIRTPRSAKWNVYIDAGVMLHGPADNNTARVYCFIRCVLFQGFDCKPVREFP